MIRRSAILIALAALVVCASTAFADVTLTYTDLHNSSWYESTAYAVQEGQQGGMSRGSQDGATFARLWTGDPNTSLNLGYPNGVVRDIYSSDKAGEKDGHAGVWTGTANTYSDINPLGASASVANAIYGNKCAGSATYGTAVNATVWTKSGSVWAPTDYNPAGYQGSVIEEMVQDIYVGTAYLNQRERAYLWDDVNHERIDLHPGGYASQAWALLGRNLQGGGVRWTENCEPGAVVWRGSSTDYIRMDPTDSNSSFISSMDVYKSGYACGGQIAFGPGNYMPALWLSLNRDDYILLDTPGYTGYGVYDIKTVGNTIYAVGSAYEIGTLEMHAMLWTYTNDTIPEPSSMIALLCGITGIGGVALRRRR